MLISFMVIICDIKYTVLLPFENKYYRQFVLVIIKINKSQIRKKIILGSDPKHNFIFISIKIECIRN